VGGVSVAAVAAVSVATVRGVAVGAVAVGRQIADLLDVAVHAALKQGVEPGGLRLDLLEVGEFGADREAALVRRVARQTELLGVVDFEGDGHEGAFAGRLRGGNEKPRSPQGAGAAARPLLPGAELFELQIVIPPEEP
jgi:hypothetical protein